MSFAEELGLKGELEHLISEATRLLGEDSSLEKAENHKERRVSSSGRAREDDVISEAEDAVGIGRARRRVAGENEKTGPKTEKDESDRLRNKSTERDFWFRLAEQSF